MAKEGVKYSKAIYFCMSKDMCDNKMTNIWELSQIKLPYKLYMCTCLITQQNTWYPKLIILGGNIPQKGRTNKCLEYNLFDIIGSDTFCRFMIDFTQVMHSVFPKQTKHSLFFAFFTHLHKKKTKM